MSLAIAPLSMALYLASAFLFLLAAAPALAQCPPTTVTFAYRGETFETPDGRTRVNSFTIGQDDAVLALLKYVPPSDTYDWEFVRLRSRELLPLISIRGEPSRLSPGERDTLCVTQQVSLAGLPAGSSYDYELRLVDRVPDPDRTVYATQLFVRVHEEVHIEVTTGPVYSWAERATYELVSRQPPEEGSAAFREIVAREAEGEGGVVTGATFRPWGYDPRSFSPRNLHFFVGLSITDKPLENFYAGFGGGGRGFSVVAGAHAYRRDRLRDGFTAGQRDPLIAAIGEAVEQAWKLAPFIGAQIDLATFGRVFQKSGS